MINYSLICCSYNARERFGGFALSRKYFCEETLVLLEEGKNKAVCKQSWKRRNPSPWSSKLHKIPFCRELLLSNVKNFFEPSNPGITQKCSNRAAQYIAWTGIAFNFSPDWAEKVRTLVSVEGETYWKLQSRIRLKREDDTGKIFFINEFLYPEQTQKVLWGEEGYGLR